jgi:endonuclease VIII
MPEGDSLHRAAEQLRVLEGQALSVRAEHPRAQVLGIAEQVDGRRLERARAVGKNLVLEFEGGLVLRSHLRMKGRWQVLPAGTELHGRPWLVLRGERLQGVLWNGPVLELGAPRVGHLGPDVMDDPPEVDEMLRRFRATDQSREVGEALLDQRLVAGIGNLWKAEGLHDARLSPWARLSGLSDDRLGDLLGRTSRLMRAGRMQRTVYRRAGRHCRRCGETIESAPQGEEARTAYWCPGCQIKP